MREVMTDESIERWLPVWKIGSSIPGRIKPMTYQIDTSRYLIRHSALIGEGKHWFVQCHTVTVTVSGMCHIIMWSWCRHPGFPVG